MARRVGGARVKATRASPGSGVNRKPRCLRESCIGGRASDALEGSDDANASLHDAVPYSVQVVSAGSRLGRQRKKCLQACAVDMLRGDVRERVAARLKRDCWNADTSGYGGCSRSVRNFEVVRKTFIDEKLCAWVFEVDCVQKSEAINLSAS